MTYEPVIGLEVHVQLKTATKAFCGCANLFGSKENSHTCPVCLGLPGALPVFNEKALKSGVKVALALNCAVRTFTKFDRKNYYYPDLPKNFQISQYDVPFAQTGSLEIQAREGRRLVKIKRVHLEEDAGKLIHAEDGPYSLVDYNRAGTPLLEIVTEPDLFSPQEAYDYLTDLKLILQYLDVSDCDMEKGTLRCDANVSLRPAASQTLGTKTELKNMNSFKAVKMALDYEIRRQADVLAEGGRILQETLLWDEKKQATHSMRSKEEAHDYRYFPEPDLPPFVMTTSEIEEIRKELPELPEEKRRRFTRDFGLSRKDSETLTASVRLADFFEACVNLSAEPKKTANWLIGPVSFQMNSRNQDITQLRLSPSALMELIDLAETGKISQLAAKDVLQEMLETGEKPSRIVEEKNLGQVSDSSVLKTVIEQVLAAHQKSVADYQSGKENALMFLVGQVMRASGGKANPKTARQLLIERLKP
ncbi:MAG: Asp-tRNA(Asn)/Glu-tRNA(Gln) amidotransferase subunit GatB [Candidatus Omnitrophota bacterium]